MDDETLGRYWKGYNSSEDIAPDIERTRIAGLEGMNLVDRAFERYGRFNLNDVSEEEKNKSKWREWGNIAFRRFPELLPGETILVREVRERIGELKSAGYDVKPGHNRLRKSEAWNCLKQIRGEIRSHLS